MTKAEKVLEKITNRLEFVTNQISEIKTQIEKSNDTELVISLNSWIFEQYTLQELLED